MYTPSIRLLLAALALVQAIPVNVPSRVPKTIENPKATMIPPRVPLSIVIPSSTSTTSSSKSTSSSRTSSSSRSTSSSRSSSTAKPSSSTRSSSSSRSSTSSRSTTTSQAPAATSSTYTVTYYPNWVMDSLPPSKVDYSLFDIINYSFGYPTSDGGVTIDSWSVDNLKDLVKRAGAAHKRVVISIGGWSDSQYFSQNVASSAARTKFADSMVALVSTYNLSGVDLDWEYPGTSGSTDNYSSKDSANLLSFLKLLRSKFDTTFPNSPKKIIAMAVTQQPFAGADGNPMSDVSEYAKYLSYVFIMNYDVYGSSSSKPGPNAPYSDACGNSRQPQYNAVAAVKQWTKAGFPANQLMMGLAAYGYVSQSSATAIVPRRLRKRQDDDEQLCPGNHSGSGKCDRNTPSRQSAGIPAIVSTLASAKILASTSGDLSDFTGSNTQVKFSELISYGVLQKSGSTYVGKNGYTRKWDSCSSTPYLYNQNKGFFVSYDDQESLAIKSKFAKDQGLLGVGTWEISGDTSDWFLSKAIQAAFK